MMQERGRATKMLRWVNQYPGWWYLICTPGAEEMRLSTMQLLIEQLHKASLDELIFVLLMVHRKEPYMKHVTEYLLLERLIERWDDDREKIVGDMIALFE